MKNLTSSEGEAYSSNISAKSSIIGFSVLVCGLLTTPLKALAWGGRGHHTICDAAGYLTQEKGLRDYLKSKGHIMGYLCNIPDTYWRDISGEYSKLGAPTHYVDMEILGVKPEDFPTNLRAIIEKYQGKESPLEKGKTLHSIPSEMGTNWWRADQFYRRAISLADKWKAMEVPKGAKEEQNDDLDFNKAAWDFMLNLGFMGHFVGDNGQPYHSTEDYDGYGQGHGGIHSYYEETMVSAQGPELLTDVIKEAQKFQKQKSKTSFLKNESVLENMKQLAVLSHSDIKEINKIDKVLSPSILKEEKGMKIKTPAQREGADKMGPRFKALITKHMARSAALLAQIWDQAYMQVGRPNLVAHKSYRFPHKPDFVVPDYVEEAPEKK